VPAKTIKMPDSLRLAGRTFKLSLAGAGMQNADLGEYDAKASTIRIREGMHDDITKSVVLHEILHDLDFQSGFDLTEVQVNSLAALLFAALRDNPKLVAWLMS
jgi:hypothetical protein